jgi:hypothetical protein
VDYSREQIDTDRKTVERGRRRRSRKRRRRRRRRRMAARGKRGKEAEEIKEGIIAAFSTAQLTSPSA